MYICPYLSLHHICICISVFRFFFFEKMVLVSPDGRQLSYVNSTSPDNCRQSLATKAYTGYGTKQNEVVYY
jgi:hypothetical protein